MYFVPQTVKPGYGPALTNTWANDCTFRADCWLTLSPKKWANPKIPLLVQWRTSPSERSTLC